MNPPKEFAGEKYNLRWNSYKNSLVHYLGDHLAQEELVDATLACEGKYIKVHKLILSACSPYFKDLFRIHKVDNPLIILNNVKFEELKYVIDFIYNGEIKVLDSDLRGVLSLGNNLKIKGLSNIKEKNVEKKNNPDLKESTSEETQNQSDGSKVRNNEEKNSDIENQPVRTKPKAVIKSITNNASKSKSSSKVTNKSEQLSDNEYGQKNSTPNPKKYKGKVTSDQRTSSDNSEIKRRKISNEHSQEDGEDVQNVSPALISLPEPMPALPPEANDVGNSALTEEQIDCLDPTKVPDISSKLPVRRISAFMIFANEWRKRLAVEHPDETNKQISVRLSNMWKNLSEETKDTFYETASRTVADQKLKIESEGS